MPPLPPYDPGLEAIVATRGISKGLAQTEGPQLLAKGYVTIGSLQVGAQYKNIDSPVADAEAAAFATYTPKLEAVQLTLTAAYKFQTRVRGPADSRAFEFTIAGTRKLSSLVSVRASAVLSPDELGATRRSAYFELGSAVNLDRKTTVSGGMGRRERSGGPDYTSFNLGVSRSILKEVALDARYYTTSHTELGEIYHGRVVASVRFKL
jgi:hypothetical protein